MLNRSRESGLAWFIATLVLVSVGASAAAGLVDSNQRVCGHVETVVCAGPSSPATMQLIVPSGSLLKSSRILQIIIPAKYRDSFGRRIEEAFEHQSVCVADGKVTDAARIVVDVPDQLSVSEPRNAVPTDPPGAFRTCDAGIDPPAVIDEHQPRWPATPRIDGTVVLRAVVDTAGRVRDTRIVRSLDPAFDAAAQKAFSEWRFRPGLLKGTPVSVVVTAELTIKHV